MHKYGFLLCEDFKLVDDIMNSFIGFSIDWWYIGNGAGGLIVVKPDSSIDSFGEGDGFLEDQKSPLHCNWAKIENINWPETTKSFDEVDFIVTKHREWIEDSQDFKNDLELFFETAKNSDVLVAIDAHY